MLYIAEIELLNFIQLRGKKYHKFYDPFFSYIFIGPNGSGKSSIMAEHDPRPVVHGSTTILKGFEGMKKIIYRDTEDRSYGLKVVHYYKPKPDKKKDDDEDILKPDTSKHTVSSFLYELHYDDIVNTVVNGQTSQFKEVFETYFGLTYESISITTIGVKFGKTMFNLMSCNDTERYNYLKMVLKSVDEVKRLEDIINSKSQLINRRLKDYKTIISSISQIDFDHEIKKLELDIGDYSKQKEIHSERKMRLGIEYDKVSSVSLDDRDAYIREFKDLKTINGVVGDDSYIDEYEQLHNKFNELYAEKQMRLKRLSSLKSDIIDLESSNPSDRKFEIQSLQDDIFTIESAANDEVPYDLSKLDITQSNLAKIHNLIERITMYPDILFEDVFKYDTSLNIQFELGRLQSELSKLFVRRSDIQSETISDHEREFFFKGNVPYTSNCDKCTMYQRRIDVESKIKQLDMNTLELEDIYKKIESLNMEINKIERVQSLFNYVVDFRRLIDESDDSILREIITNDTVQYFFNNIEHLEDHVKTMKYNAMNQIRLRDMKNKLNTLLSDDTMDKLNTLNVEFREESIQLNHIDEQLNHINSNPLYIISKEVAYKYSSLDRSKRINELNTIISELSSISEMSRSIEKEITELDNALITIAGLLERKNSELIKVQIEKSRFEENTSNYMNELSRSKKADKLKTLLSKKIPTIFLDLYMIYVRDEANLFLEDTGRYSLKLPLIRYDESSKRNTFIIPISDNGETKSCSVLSKGEENIINIAVTLPLIYIATDKYRIPRMDEIDSTLDSSMKKLQMDEVLNLPPDKISQLFMVSHSPREFFDANERCRVIDLSRL